MALMYCTKTTKIPIHFKKMYAGILVVFVQLSVKLYATVIYYNYLIYIFILIKYINFGILCAFIYSYIRNNTNDNEYSKLRLSLKCGSASADADRPPNFRILRIPDLRKKSSLNCGCGFFSFYYFADWILRKPKMRTRIFFKLLKCGIKIATN